MSDRYAEHLIERTAAKGKRRLFRPAADSPFRAKSYLVLTEAGVALARRTGKPETPSGSKPAKKRKTPKSQPPATINDVPFWHDGQKTLFWRDREVYHFKNDAPNEETMLRVFQKWGWPRSVPVDFRQELGKHWKKRLHDTVQNLNRRIKGTLRIR